MHSPTERRQAFARSAARPRRATSASSPQRAGSRFAPTPGMRALSHRHGMTWPSIGQSSLTGRARELDRTVEPQATRRWHCVESSDRRASARAEHGCQQHEQAVSDEVHRRLVSGDETASSTSPQGSSLGSTSPCILGRRPARLREVVGGFGVRFQVIAAERVLTHSAPGIGGHGRISSSVENTDRRLHHCVRQPRSSNASAGGIPNITRDHGERQRERQIPRSTSISLRARPSSSCLVDESLHRRPQISRHLGRECLLHQAPQTRVVGRVRCEHRRRPALHRAAGRQLEPQPLVLVVAADTRPRGRATAG